MRIVQAPRASSILYNLLKSRGDTKPWLLPTNICPVVPVTFFKAGIPIEFVDISSETLHMDLRHTEKRLEQDAFGGVLYAHTYGESSTPNKFFQKAKLKHPDLLLVDDRCLCIPELYPNAQMFADVVLYSTGSAKVVDLGFGGYAFLKNNVLYRHEKLPFNASSLKETEESYKQAIRGGTPYIYHDSDWLQTDTELPAWYDYRLQIEAGLKKSLETRTYLNEIYRSHLPKEILLPDEYQTWRFNIRPKDNKHILLVIFESGLFASSHYPSLAGIMAPGYCPQAEILATEIVNLFNDQHFNGRKAHQVCAIINENLPVTKSSAVFHLTH